MLPRSVGGGRPNESSSPQPDRSRLVLASRKIGPETIRYWSVILNPILGRPAFEPAAFLDRGCGLTFFSLKET
jgi:hypothetical protein